ncbi:hypothetical protein BC833DRAFT_570740 [Globomyces pollinis-pini]|nr:hypothetical protein BC833DRAFT_570740 [Globomyces pollinis-pini]
MTVDTLGAPTPELDVMQTNGEIIKGSVNECRQSLMKFNFQVLYAILIAVCLGNAIIIGTVHSDLLGSIKALPRAAPKSPPPLITGGKQSKPVADQSKTIKNAYSTYKPSTQTGNSKPVYNPSNSNVPATTSTPNLCLSKAVSTWKFAGTYPILPNYYWYEPINTSGYYVRAFTSDNRFSMYVADTNGYIYTDPGCICEDVNECVLDCYISSRESLNLIPSATGPYNIDAFDVAMSSNYLSRAACGPSNSAKALNPCFAFLPLILAVV